MVINLRFCPKMVNIQIMINLNKLELFCVEYRRIFFVTKHEILFKNEYRL
jgi:hypothetical protein